MRRVVVLFSVIAVLLVLPAAGAGAGAGSGEDASGIYAAPYGGGYHPYCYPYGYQYGWAPPPFSYAPSPAWYAPSPAWYAPSPASYAAPYYAYGNTYPYSAPPGDYPGIIEVTATRANVRSTTSVREDNLLGVLPQGTRLRATGRTSGPWNEVIYGGRYAYIHSTVARNIGGDPADYAAPYPYPFSAANYPYYARPYSAYYPWQYHGW